jgi:hypothetical protein
MKIDEEADSATSGEEESSDVSTIDFEDNYVPRVHPVGEMLINHEVSVIDLSTYFSDLIC